MAMHKIFTCAQRRMRVGELKLIPLKLGIGCAVAFSAAMMAPSSHAQSRELVNYELRIIGDALPDEGFKLFSGNYITLSGRFEYDPIHYYEYDKERFPELFSTFPTDDPATTSFKMETNFFGVDGSMYEDVDEMLVTSGPVNKRMLTGGRYKGFKRHYTQPNPNVGPNEPEVFTGWVSSNTRVLYPVVKKIPFYVASDLLEDVLFESTEKIPRYFEPNRFNEYVGFEPTKVAMDLMQGKTEMEHFACPIWYEFKFMGYVDGFENGIALKEDMDRLPDGVTFVSSIQNCGGVTKPGMETYGCAKDGGEKVAAIARLVREHVTGDSNNLGAVLLHELLHTQGASDHIVGDPENLMTDSKVLDNPYLDQEQCEMLIKRKSYTMGFSGLEPWE